MHLPRTRLLAVSLFAGLITLLFVFPSLAQENDPEARDAKREMISRLVEEGYNQGDFTGLDEIFAADYAYVGYTPDGDTSLEAAKARITAYRDAMPDFEVVPELIVVDGEWAAARLVYHGTFTAPFVEGETTFEPNNEAIESGHTVIYRFNEDGQIVEEFDNYDRLNLLARMGALPIPDFLATALSAVIDNTSVTEGDTTLNGLEEDRRIGAVAFVEAIDAGDLDVLDETLSEDYISYDSFGKLDRQGLKDLLALFHATAPDLEVFADALLVEGDWVAIRLIYRGTFENPIQAGVFTVEPTGKPLQFAINVIARFNEDNLVVEDWREFNRMAWFQQLGLLPAQQ